MDRGIHTIVVPTIGTTEHSPVRNADRKAFGTPKNIYPVQAMIPCMRASIGMPMAFDLTITFTRSIVSFLFMFFIGMMDERYSSILFPPVSRKNRTIRAAAIFMKKSPMPLITDCPRAVTFPAMKVMFFSDIRSIPVFSLIMSTVCMAGARMSPVFQFTCWSLAMMNHTSNDSGITMKSMVQISMMLADSVGLPVFSESLKHGFLSSMYRVSAPSMPLIKGCICLNSIMPSPKIIISSANSQMVSVLMLFLFSIQNIFTSRTVT